MFKENHLLIFSGLLLTFFVASLFYINPKLINKVEYNLYDYLVSQLEQTEPSGLVTIIDIDEKSLAELGQWPWPRNQVAQLLEKLQQMQVLSVGIDFLFAETDRSSLENVVSRLNYPELSEKLSLNSLPDYLLNNDQKLSQVLASGPFVLGYSFVFEQDKSEYTKFSDKDPGGDLNIFYLKNEVNNDSAIKKPNNLWFQPDGVINNLDMFAKRANAAGFFNMSPEKDSLIRKVPLVMQYQDKIYPSLALSTLLLAIQVDQVIHKQSNSGIDYLVIDEHEIPIDKSGNMWIHFRDTQDSVFNTISAVDILKDRVPIEQVAGHIALLGTSAKGLFDLRSTPYNAVFPGVGVHATLIDNIIRQDFITHPHWSWFAQLLLIIVVGFISLFIFIKANAVANFIINSLIIFGLFYASWWWLQHDQIYISVLYPLLMVFLNYSFLLLIKYRYKEKRLVIETLEHNKIQKIALDQLEEAKSELEDLNNSLEIKVAERTEELAKINQYTRESIEYASLIQHALIIEPEIFAGYFQGSFAIWEPKDIVGGDIYLVETLNEDEILIMLIDCTGHGVPGAFVTMLVKAIERQIVSKIYQSGVINPAEILKNFNIQIKSLLKQDDKNSVSNAGFDGAILHFNKKSRELHFASANTPLFVYQKGKLDIIKGDRYSIGYNSSDPDHDFTNKVVSLNVNDNIYVSSDGFLDQIGGDKKFPYGKKRFKNFLSTIQEHPMIQQKELFLEEINNYQADLGRVDDVTVIGLTIT